MKNKAYTKVIAIGMSFLFIFQLSASSSGELAQIPLNTPTLDYKTLTNNEKLIYDYYDSIDGENWGPWASYYISTERASNLNFATNAQNQADYMGILTVTSARVVTIDKVDNSRAPRYPEFMDYFESEDNYECYMVGIDQTVKQETDYNFNGINYKLVLLLREDSGSWGIGGVSGCPFDLMQNVEDSHPVSTAMQDYAERAIKIKQDIEGEISPLGIGHGTISGNNCEPKTINVGLGFKCANGKQMNVPFCLFVRKGAQGEIGNMNYHSEAFKACVMAVKMAGWWAALGHWRDTYGVDIFGDFDVAYNPNNIPTANIENAYEAIENYGVQTSSGEFFYTAYLGASYVGSAGCGILSQNGSNTLASQGYSWRDIIHYYYDNSNYNGSNTGIVKIISTVH